MLFSYLSLFLALMSIALPLIPSDLDPFVWLKVSFSHIPVLLLLFYYFVSYILYPCVSLYFSFYFACLIV